jgi:ParB family chromosome partitioning protein
MAKQALEGDRVNAFAVDPESLTIVGLDTKADASHPLYDEERLKVLDPKQPAMQGLIQSMDLQGNLEPIRVRKNGDLVEVVMGTRRTFAAREVNKIRAKRGDPPIKIFVLRPDKDTDEVFFGMRIAENTQREGYSALAEAKNIAQYMKMTGANEDKAAVYFAVSPQTIKDKLALLDLSPKVQKAMVDGKIDSTPARQLVQLKREEQDEAIDELLADSKGKKPTVEKARAVRNKKKTGKKSADSDLYIGRTMLRKMVKLALADKEAGKLKITDDTLAVLRVIVGEPPLGLPKNKVAGLTELFNRAEWGEKPGEE